MVDGASTRTSHVTGFFAVGSLLAMILTGCAGGAYQTSTPSPSSGSSASASTMEHSPGAADGSPMEPEVDDATLLELDRAMDKAGAVAPAALGSMRVETGGTERFKINGIARPGSLTLTAACRGTGSVRLSVDNGDPEDSSDDWSSPLVCRPEEPAVSSWKIPGVASWVEVSSGDRSDAVMMVRMDDGDGTDG